MPWWLWLIALSILFMRFIRFWLRMVQNVVSRPFNSLYEILLLAEIQFGKVILTFNSLYEIQIFLKIYLSNFLATFNSLYEIPGFLTRPGFYWQNPLSILFMRFVKNSLRLLGLFGFLSILFMRFNTFSTKFIWIYYRLSILFMRFSRYNY